MNLPSFFIDDSDSMKYEETIDFLEGDVTLFDYQALYEAAKKAAGTPDFKVRLKANINPAHVLRTAEVETQRYGKTKILPVRKPLG